MTTMPLIDAELRPLLENLPAFELTPDALPQARAAALAMVTPSDVKGIRKEEHRVPGGGSDPDVRVLVYAPEEENARRPALLHIHGGGYVLGAPEMNEDRNQRLALELGCVIVSVDYRLAPETSFPGPLEDCYVALAWLHANAIALNVDVQRIAIIGESAGGGLAAALALLVRDRSAVPLVGQVLIYPMIDDRTGSSAQRLPVFGEFVWKPELNRLGWTSYLGRSPEEEAVLPYAAAARARDVSGLPSTFIAVGALDLFLEEDMTYAGRLMAAGVPTELHVLPGACHGFDAFAPEAAISKEMVRLYTTALRRLLAPTPIN